MRPLLVLLPLIFVASAAAQDVQDSLIQRLSASTGVMRADILEQLAVASKQKDPSAAWTYGKEALTLTEIAHDITRAERLSFFLGSLKRSQNSFDTARQFFERAHAFAREAGDDKRVADNLNAIGTTYQHQGNLTTALEFYLKALEIAETSSLQKIVGDAYNNIGFIYKIQRDDGLALQYYRRALAVRRSIGDDHGVAGALNNIGMVHMDNARYDSALHFYFASAKLLSEERHPREMAMIYNNLGVTYEDQGRFEEGRGYYEKSLALKRKLHDRRGMASTYGNISNNYLESGDAAQAIRFGDMSLVLAKEVHALEYMVTAAENLAHAHASLGHYREAFRYHVHFKKYQDSLYDESRSRQVAEMAAKYDADKKTRENDVLRSAATLTESQMNKQQMIIMAVAGGLGFVVLMFLFLFQLYQKSRSLTAALSVQKLEMETTNAQLQEVLQEKNNVMNIMAHDLRSPMNKVMGLTQLIQLQGPVNPQQQHCLTLISDVADQGKRIINDLLLINKEGAFKMQATTFSLTDFIRVVARQYTPEAERKNISLLLDLPEKNIIITADKDCLMRILDNLTSNAIKFSPSGKAVSFRAAQNETHVTIAVCDQGPGFSGADKKELFKKFKRLSAQPTGGEPSSGLGLAIVKHLTHQLGGTITLTSDVDQGATFEVTLPLRAG